MRTLSIKNTALNCEDAMSLLELNTYQYQRPMNPGYIEILKRKMKAGLHVGANIVFAKLNGTTCLCDGQHTLTALAETYAEIDATIKTVLCESNEELTFLYQQFDGGRSRSIRDHARAEAGLLKISWPQKILAAVISGAGIIKHGFNQPRDVSKDERVRLLREFRDEGDFVNNIISTGPSNRFLLRRHVVAVMMQTYTIDRHAAEGFWIDVRDGEMLTKTHPEFHLREFLITTNTRGSGRIAGGREMYVKACKAWNCFRTDGEMKTLRYNPDEKTPKLVL